MASNQFNNFVSQLGIKNPNRSNTGFNYSPFIVAQGEQTPGQTLYDKIGERKSTGSDIYQNNRQKDTSRVAQDIASKSAFDIPTDEFGQVNQTLTDPRSTFMNQMQGTSQRGRLALRGEEAKSAWKQAKEMQDLDQYSFTGGIEITSGTTKEGTSGATIPGASSDNPGAKAVALAMKAEKNNTPYVWAGNSLTKGVDCSGLVQQVYRKLGIEVPRTTWLQAKHGKEVSINAMRPGDLVFYRNTSHVGIYIGNGKFVHAANKKLGTIVSNVYGSSNGKPEMAIRPY